MTGIFMSSAASAQRPDSVFSVGGTYTFVVPAGVTSICAIVVGAGVDGDAGINTAGPGGGGGGTSWKNNITVTPGEFLTVKVGAHQPWTVTTATTASPASSYITRANGTFIVAVNAAHGQTGGSVVLTSSSVSISDGGGCGGSTLSMINNRDTTGGGGGGAGGYLGQNTGNGLLNSSVGLSDTTAYLTKYYLSNGIDGGGGGGGGGTMVTHNGGGGGGCGLYGLTSSGVGSTTVGTGAGGTGGSPFKNSGLSGANANGSANAGSGGWPGGGGGGTGSNVLSKAGTGADGAVRIIWGAGRSFPYNAL